MMELNSENLTQLYRMNNIIRYNTWPKIHSETVASHSFFVSIITSLICKQLEVSLLIRLKALERAISHDVPEIIMNDITYDAKEQVKGLAETLAPFEREFLEKHFPETIAVYDGSTKQNKIAGLIVELADIISAVQYCQNEISLGNSNFIPILKGSRERIKETKRKLEECGLSCQKIMI